MPEPREHAARGQWATGAVGREAILGILDAPGLELVAVLVTSAEKEGVDAGRLAGRDPVGVPATRSVEALLAARPDCVVYTPRTPSLDDVCRLLHAGIDVVTTAFAFHPAQVDPPTHAALADACATGGSSFHASGLNPGVFSAAVPLALTGLVRRLDRLTLVERADWSVYESTEITFDQMRFGRPASEVTLEASESLRFTSDLFRQQVWLLGDALGAGLDEVVTHHEVAVARADVPVFDRVVRVGTVNGQRFRWTGRASGVDLVEIEAVWTLGEVDADWPRPQHGWTVSLEGDPSVHAHLLTMASLSKPKDMAEHVQAANAATALAIVNAIPLVHAATPGLVTAADLPLVHSLTGFARA